jgi:hypothetical protein
MTNNQWVAGELNLEQPLSRNRVRRAMKSACSVLVTSGLAAATLGLAAPAVAAPSGTGSAQDTVNQLQANGYRVILNKIGDAPLDQCTVASVRPGREITEPRTDHSGDLVQVVLYTTVYVAVTC